MEFLGPQRKRLRTKMKAAEQEQDPRGQTHFGY